MQWRVLKGRKEDRKRRRRRRKMETRRRTYGSILDMKMHEICARMGIQTPPVKT